MSTIRSIVLKSSSRNLGSSFVGDRRHLHDEVDVCHGFGDAVQVEAVVAIRSSGQLSVSSARTEEVRRSLRPGTVRPGRHYWTKTSRSISCAVDRWVRIRRAAAAAFLRPTAE
jgi:hypothetical protein